MAQTSDKVINDSTADSVDAEEPVGRVEFDSRGNSVWRWAREVLDSTSILLKRLENTDLALEPTRKVPIARVAATTPGKPAKSISTELSVVEPVGRDGAGGFDPYNSRR